MDCKMKKPGLAIARGSRVLFAGMFALAVSLAFGSAASATEGQGDESDNELVAMYTPGLTADWKKLLEEKGLEEGPNNDDVYITKGRQSVNFPIEAPGFHQARSHAFEVAYLKAKVELVKVFGLGLEKFGSFDDRETVNWPRGAEEPVERLEQAERIVKKIDDLTEAQIDGELAKMNPAYDPEKYGSREQKEKLVRSIFRQRARMVAARVVVGALPLAVLEGPVGNEYEILVGLVWSPRLADAARAIGDGYSPTNTGKKGVRISEWLPKRKNEISASWGVHKLIDENGDQVFVGFGQAAPRRASPSRQSRAADAALSRAYLHAVSAILGFVGENLTLDGSSTGDEEDATLANMALSGNIRTDLIKQYRSRARGRLKGLSKAGEWVLRHPANDQRIAVVAVSWSPKGLKMARRMGEAMDKPRRADRVSAGKVVPRSERAKPVPSLLQRENIQLQDF